MEKKHDLLSYYHSGLCASDPQLKEWVRTTVMGFLFWSHNAFKTNKR